MVGEVAVQSRPCVREKVPATFRLHMVLGYFSIFLRSPIRLMFRDPPSITKIDDQTVNIVPEDGPSSGALRAPELGKAFGGKTPEK